MMLPDRIKLGLVRDGFDLDVSFDLPARGVIALLGPSGSGKSTILRAVAGLEPAAFGLIRVAGQEWLNSALHKMQPPQARHVGMVFQDYALFEHMTVAANIGFGVPRQRRARVVDGLLESFHLQELGERFPKQLSGGQRQRVALARALAHKPDMLLLDEPLSAIDVHLRERLRTELQSLFAELDTPALLVSHDLEEARQLADHVGILVDGRLHRFGTTREVFDHPGTLEAARVLGWRNLLPVRGLAGRVVRGSWGEVRLPQEASLNCAALGIREEKVSLLPAGQGDLSGVVERIVDRGALHEVQCRLPDDSLFYVQRLWSQALPEPGSQVGLGLTLQHLVPLVEGTGLRPGQLQGLEPMQLQGERSCPSVVAASSRLA